MIVDFEMRFGDVAVEKGFVSKQQVDEALQIQIKDDSEGKGHRVVGAILKQLGYMTPQEINEILDLMGIPRG